MISGTRPAFEGDYGYITLHGDMYKHGQDAPIDEDAEAARIKVNGELSVRGMERTSP